MSRLTWFLLCAISGALMVVCGLVVPAHLRAVDACVLQQAGRNTPALIEQGLALVKQNKLGAAQLLLRAAQEEGLPDRAVLGLAIANSAAQHPGWLVWGGGDARLERLFTSDPGLPKSGSEPVHRLPGARGESGRGPRAAARLGAAGCPGTVALPRADQHRRILPVAIRLGPGLDTAAGGLWTVAGRGTLERRVKRRRVRGWPRRATAAATRSGWNRCCWT